MTEPREVRTTSNQFESKLPPSLSRQLLALADELNDHGALVGRRFERQPAAWKKTDEGNAVIAWLEDLDALIESMTDFAEAVVEEPTP
jgi:hypothetical protein